MASVAAVAPDDDSGGDAGLGDCKSGVSGCVSATDGTGGCAVVTVTFIADCGKGTGAVCGIDVCAVSSFSFPSCFSCSSRSLSFSVVSSST